MMNGIHLVQRWIHAADKETLHVQFICSEGLQEMCAQFVSITFMMRWKCKINARDRAAIGISRISECWAVPYFLRHQTREDVARFMREVISPRIVWAWYELTVRNVDGCHRVMHCNIFADFVNNQFQCLGYSFHTFRSLECVRCIPCAHD